jgi:hypothetical protein
MFCGFKNSGVRTAKATTARAHKAKSTRYLRISFHLSPQVFGIVDDAKDLTATQDFRLDLATARSPITVRWEMLRFGKVEFIIQLGRIWVANGSPKVAVLSEATALETLWAKGS